MPPSRTPLHAPPRQNARPQFASAPRFLFSQRAVAQHKETEDGDSIPPEHDSVPFTNPRPAPTPARGPASRRKEVIEDSGSELDLERNSQQQPNNINGVRHGDIPSSPPPDMTEVDTEIEALFGPTTKRRRISVNLATPAIQRRKPHDSIETSPGPSPFAADPPSPSLPYRTTPQKTPRRPATPATGKPSIRGHPCFLVSSSSSSQPPPKPTFVLPRSPSPDQAEGLTTIPTPFSPSSHALRRRGRQRSSAPSYLPGGMAAEVRSWVLEMGTKREQQIYANLGRRNEAESSVDSTRYSLKLRISKVRQSALSSCGPLAFIQGQAMLSSEDRDSADDTTRNVLLMGAPRLRPGELRTSSRVPSLQAGDVVGVLRGLVWELRAGESPSPIPDHEQILRCESEQSPGLGRWLVGMEWEVMSCA